MPDFRIDVWSDFIVVEFEEAPLSAGGLHLVNGGASDPRTARFGRVIAVGPGRMSESGQEFVQMAQVGDLLLLNGSPGTEQQVDSRSVRFIRPGDVYGKVKE